MNSRPASGSGVSSARNVAGETGSRASDSRLSPIAGDQALRGGQLDRRDPIEQRTREHRAERIGDRRADERGRGPDLQRGAAEARLAGEQDHQPRDAEHEGEQVAQTRPLLPEQDREGEQEHRVHRHVDHTGDARRDELHAPVEQPIGPDVHQHARQHDARGAPAEHREHAAHGDQQRPPRPARSAPRRRRPAERRRARPWWRARSCPRSATSGEKADG